MFFLFFFFWHSIVQTKCFGPWHPNSQSAEGGVQWRLSTGLPCPSLQLTFWATTYCYQRPLTLAMSEWYWRGSLPLAPPSKNEARMFDGSNSFLRFLFSSIEVTHTHKKISHQKLILIFWSKPKAKLLFKQTKYFRQNSMNWKCLWGTHSI